VYIRLLIKRSLTYFIGLTVLLTLLIGCKESFSSYPPKQICFPTHCFNLEIADTPKKRHKGLQHRKFLNPQTGMLFIFEAEKPTAFWMKNTFIPLDIIWITRNKTVSYIKTFAKPLDETPIHPKGAGLYILEINAGLSSKYNIKVGDKIRFK
jgi:uncharacterized protein